MSYDFKSIEKKWQEKWDESGIFNIDVKTAKDIFYTLVMFPYPSGDRLHMGHWYQYGLMDTWARYQRMQGKQVFFPMGFDAFGLPAENFAIKRGMHPDISTTKNVKYMREQFRRMGVSYNLDYQVDTSKPDYYRWTQWIFLKLYEKGLAYRKEAPVNWCPSCQTVLANEQVGKEGDCERCETQVIQKNLRQWFFKITDYAQPLLDGLDGLDWPHKTKAMQNNWIGRSQGTRVDFKLENEGESFPVFTTRPDTLFGVTYMTLAPEHPLVEKITCEENQEAVNAYVESSLKRTELERLSATDEKTGVFTGAYAVNPVNSERIPIWVGDYVLYSYGTGAVMAVPAHDQRDFEFAKEHRLPMKKVILEKGKGEEDELISAFTQSGEVIQSGPYNGMLNSEMISAITKDLEERGQGAAEIHYRLRDWLVSRQRYWGSPIPIIYCKDCGEVPVPEKDLPVVLPEDVDFKPTGESPLKRCESFMETTCPSCGAVASREPDTLDTFVCSSWYYLRFPDAHNETQAFNSDLINQVLPVSRYVGGSEHACMHLLYARFINRVLKDLGYLNFEEPFQSLTHQGMILGPDGLKMSKSHGNTVSPDEYVEQYGSDVLRLYLAFGFSYIDGGPWSEDGIRSISRFVDRVGRVFQTYLSLMNTAPPAKTDLSEQDRKLLYIFHNSLKGITQDTERFQFNTSVARMMELNNGLSEYLREVAEGERNLSLLHEVLETQVILLAPYLPHFCEDWWSRFGHQTSVFLEPWPKFQEEYLSLDTLTLAVMVNGKLRAEISVSAGTDEESILKAALEEKKIGRYLEGTKLIKHIYVKNKLVNLIIK
jgi:leucyl-tRNA synthetase